MGGDELSRVVGLLVNQVAHWEPPRWAAARAGAGAVTPPAVPGGTGPHGPGGGVSRAELMHRLVQRIADLAADAEGEPRRAVPRLDNDLALPDQLRVVATDLIAAGAPAEMLADATAQVTATRASL
ncbi:hypothetical protein [Micromonospora zhanjiangensis]|uniref:Uncharacterized protein n=1 Tax=Micromonospora zhanjiangensis TaxID=1522057 RepID=A0ABV8KRQ1_9ACTN